MSLLIRIDTSPTTLQPQPGRQSTEVRNLFPAHPISQIISKALLTTFHRSLPPPLSLPPPRRQHHNHEPQNQQANLHQQQSPTPLERKLQLPHLPKRILRLRNHHRASGADENVATATVFAAADGGHSGLRVRSGVQGGVAVSDALLGAF